MVDLQKLDSIIDDLGESAANFLKISSINEQVQQTASLVEESVESLRKVIEEVHHLNADHSNLQDTMRSTYQNLEEHFKAVQLQNAQFTSQVNTLLLEIKNEGHALNKQLENALEAKIDVMKSDIILENRNRVIETQEKISESHKGLLHALTSVQAEMIKTTVTASQDNQTAIINKSKELYQESQNQLQKQSIFFKQISFATIGLLLLTIVILWVK